VAEEELPGSPSTDHKTSIPTVAATAVQASSLTGWNALRYALNKTMPADLAQATQLQRETVRVLNGK
jgi:hypothetical protein